LPTKTPHNTPAFDVDYIEDTGQGPALQLPASAVPGATGTGIGGAPAVVSAPAPTAPIPTPALPPRGPTLPSMTPGPAQSGSVVEAAAAALSHPFKIEKKLSFSSATAQEEHAQGSGDIDDAEEEEEDDIGGVSQEPLQPPQEGTVAFTAGLIANDIVDEAIDRVIDTAVSGTADAEDVNIAGAVVHDEDVLALPVGWQELTDPGSGQSYFYNSETGETSWNRPTLAETSEDDVAGPSSENEEDAAHHPPETEVSEETVKTRSSWEIVDDGAEPEPEPAEVLPSAEGGNDGDSVDKWEAASPEAEDTGLPNGWVQVIDETTGEPYVSSSFVLVYFGSFLHPSYHNH